MRKWGVLAALTAFVVAATVAIASARSLYQVVELPAPAEQTLVLTSVPTRDKFVDADQNGRDSVGDLVLFRARLTDEAEQPAGTAHVRCVLHFKAVVCDGVLTLSGGQILVHGRAGESETFDVPVTGGTGAFADVGGQLHVETLDEGAEELTLSLYHFAS